MAQKVQRIRFQFEYFIKLKNHLRTPVIQTRFIEALIANADGSDKLRPFFIDRLANRGISTKKQKGSRYFLQTQRERMDDRAALLGRFLDVD